MSKETKPWELLASKEIRDDEKRNYDEWKMKNLIK